MTNHTSMEADYRRWQAQGITAKEALIAQIKRLDDPGVMILHVHLKDYLLAKPVKPTSFKCPTTKELNRHSAAIQAATLHVGAIPAHPQKRPVNPYPTR